MTPRERVAEFLRQWAMSRARGDRIQQVRVEHAELAMLFASDLRAILDEVALREGQATIEYAVEVQDAKGDLHIGQSLESLADAVAHRDRSVRLGFSARVVTRTRHDRVTDWIPTLDERPAP